MESTGANFIFLFVMGVAVVLTVLIYWLNKRQNYFKDHNIPCIQSYPLIGSLLDALLGKIGIFDMMVDFYNKPGLKGQSFFGLFLFHKPALMINDPEIIKRIFVTDFNKFSNRYAASDIHDGLGYYNLFFVKNPLWKSLRAKFSTFFSSGKLKVMYYLVEKISDNMIAYIHKRLDKNGKVELELKELASLYTTDVIASCAFGVEANSLENPNGEFHKSGTKIFEMSLWRNFEMPAIYMLPQVMKLFNFKVFTHEVSNFVGTTIRSVMRERERTGIRRNDLIDTLIELKNSEEKVNNLDISIDMLMAQAAVFFAAAFETSSSTQSFALYEIAKNEDIQDKIRSEIREMLDRTDGKVSYDVLMNASDMPYLHQIINETLRLYPVLPVHDRECIDPNGYSLEPQSSFRIPYKMPLWIPVYAIHRDEKFFPNPLNFDPERFSPENIKNIRSGTFMPFGIGPRQCIGERFGLMQTKTGIVKILKDFRLETTSNTPKEIILEKKSMVMQSEKGLFLNLVKDPLY